MLNVEELHAFYGKSHVLHGVTLRVRPGEIVRLLGRNGTGRSTALKAIMGLVEARGRIEWRGRAIRGLPAFQIAHRGLGYVPESRDVFPRLSVLQNLQLAEKSARGGANRWSLTDMYRMFPRLPQREHTEAGVLSGSEQQMLTLCRTLMGAPDLIKSTEGLAPKIVQQVAEYLRELRVRGISVLLVEQKLAIAMEVSDRCYVMGHGRIVFEGTPHELRDNSDVRREWLEVGGTGATHPGSEGATRYRPLSVSSGAVIFFGARNNAIFFGGRGMHHGTRPKFAAGLKGARKVGAGDTARLLS